MSEYIIYQPNVKPRKPDRPKHKYLALIREICKRIDIDYDEVIGLSRVSDIKNYRHAFMRLLRHELGLGYKHIGDIFNRDHTTAIHSIAIVEDTLYSKGYQDKAVLTAYNEIDNAYFEIQDEKMNNREQSNDKN
jgi:chromosomal replication initiation ATPase DnaA